MRDIVSHLVEVRGCQRIAYIGPTEGKATAEERGRAYLSALEAHGISADPALTKPGDYGDGGVAGVQYLLDEQGLVPARTERVAVSTKKVQAMVLLHIDQFADA